MDILQQLAKQQGQLDRRVRRLNVTGNSSPWRNAPETWVYASATTFTITDADSAAAPVMIDATNTYQAGDFIRLKQGGAYLYFIISAVAYADPTTTVTIDKQITGGQVALANAAITDNYYSKAWSPQGCGPTRFTPGYYTSTDWDGDAKNGADGIIDLSAAFGLPAGIKAVSLQFIIVDETVYVWAQLSSTSVQILDGMTCYTQVANVSSSIAGIVFCDSNGDIYFGQGGELDAVRLVINGYWS